jgi:hypothetical protein
MLTLAHTYVCCNCERVLACVKTNCRGLACRIQCASCTALGFKKTLAAKKLLDTSLSSGVQEEHHRSSAFSPSGAGATHTGP